MEKITVLKLGTVCTDIATKLEGTLTHWTVGMGKQIDYIFQPKGLDKEGQPVKRLYLEVERLNVEKDDFEEVEVPFEILGTDVTDKASGFKGMAVGFVRHINGCFHVFIQPKGLRRESNLPIDKNDFDLRGCSGKMIQPLSEKKLKESEKDHPSPSGGSFDFDPKLSTTKYKKY